MTEEAVLTEVEAHVDPTREAEVIPAFQALLDTGLPPGLVRTQLLRGTGNLWRIQSLWEDQRALDAMRAQPEPPAAPALFRSLGAEPTLQILNVRGSSA